MTPHKQQAGAIRCPHCCRVAAEQGDEGYVIRIKKGEWSVPLINLIRCRHCGKEFKPGDRAGGGER